RRCRTRPPGRGPGAGVREDGGAEPPADEGDRVVPRPGQARAGGAVAEVVCRARAGDRGRRAAGGNGRGRRVAGGERRAHRPGARREGDGPGGADGRRDPGGGARAGARVRIERRRAALSGGELSYLDGGEGPAVVLLHGFPSSAYLWRRELPLLGSRMRVVAPDLLGYGESEKPPEADFTVRAQAGYVGELLDVLGIGAAAFVGHDLGGGVAQLLALEGRAAAIVLLDTVCF